MVEADAKSHAPILVQFLIQMGELALDFDGAAHRFSRAWKLRYAAVAGASEDAALVNPDEVFNDRSMFLEERKSCIFGSCDQTAIADRIRRQNSD